MTTARPGQLWEQVDGSGCRLWLCMVVSYWTTTHRQGAWSAYVMTSHDQPGCPYFSDYFVHDIVFTRDIGRRYGTRWRLVADVAA